ncbi:MAG: hypothetical protein QM627_00570 [Luteolibacter sp.]
MKLPLIALLTAFVFSSCATMVPLDPMTASPCPKCLPGNFDQQNQKCYSCDNTGSAK